MNGTRVNGLHPNLLHGGEVTKVWWSRGRRTAEQLRSKAWHTCPQCKPGTCRFTYWCCLANFNLYVHLACDASAIEQTDTWAVKPKFDHLHIFSHNHDSRLGDTQGNTSRKPQAAMRPGTPFRALHATHSLTATHKSLCSSFYCHCTSSSLERRASAKPVARCHL